MERIRIGNDLDISISVYNNGGVYDLTGKSVKLYLISPMSRIEKSCTISSNKIEFRFDGTEQQVCGKYNVEIQIINGDSKNTLDSCDGFKLVDRSCKTGGDDGEFEVNSLNLNLNI